MRLLITGGAGFIGSEFVRMTLKRHPADSVIVLDKLTYSGNRSNLATVEDDPRFSFVRGDIVDTDLVNEIAARVDAIVNFAAETHVDRSLEAPGQFITTNVHGTWVLIDAARRAKHDRFLQVSTDEVYGDVDAYHSVEDDPLRPSSPYSASKAGAEFQVWAYVRSFGFPALVTRGCNSYGPYQFPEKIIPLFILNAMEGRPLPIYGDGTAVRDYLPVTEHAAAIDTVLRSGKPGNAYNVGAGLSISTHRIAEIITDLLGTSPALMQPVLDRRGHDRRYSVASDKIHALGWRPMVPLEAGIAATVRWYTNNPDWWGALRDPAYWAYYRRTYTAVHE